MQVGVNQIAIDRAEAIIRLMHDIEIVLCSSCSHRIACAGIVNEYCMLRFAEQAKVMCGGKIE